LPSVARYVPASQSWHASAREAPEAWPYLPLAHKTQEAIEPAAVVVENEPLAQGTQESLPSLGAGYIGVGWCIGIWCQEPFAFTSSRP